MEIFLNDLRHALRILSKRPGFVFACVITLALAFGANTAIFSVVNAVLLRPPPYKDPARLVMLWQADPKRGVDHFSVSIPYFKGWREHNRVFEQVAAFSGAQVDLTGQRGPEQVAAMLVSANFFSTLGVEPFLGRTLVPEEDAPNHVNVAVISHELWQRRFGGVMNLAGQVLTTDSANYAVVGVMPPEFRFLSPSDIWIPLGRGAESLRLPPNLPLRV